MRNITVESDSDETIASAERADCAYNRKFATCGSMTNPARPTQKMKACGGSCSNVLAIT